MNSAVEVTLVIVLSIFILDIVSAHGYVSKPAAEFKGGKIDASQVVQLNGIDILPGFNWGQTPAQNGAEFTKAFKAQSKYKTLKDLMRGEKTKDDCGNSDPNASPKDLPADGIIEFKDDDNTGFFFDHFGPCELWCDKERVFVNENCAENIKSVPAKMKIENSKCKGAKMLRFYWLAVHNPSWQFYKNCIPLTGASPGGLSKNTTTSPEKLSSSSGSDSGVALPSITPSSTTTEAPMAGSNGNEGSEKPTSTTPVMTTTSTPTSVKCRPKK